MSELLTVVMEIIEYITLANLTLFLFSDSFNIQRSISDLATGLFPILDFACVHIKSPISGLRPFTKSEKRASHLCFRINPWMLSEGVKNLSWKFQMDSSFLYLQDWSWASNAVLDLLSYPQVFPFCLLHLIVYNWGLHWQIKCWVWIWEPCIM